MSAIRCTGCDAIGESSLATLYCASCYKKVKEDRAVLLKAAKKALEFLESIPGYGDGSSAIALRNAIEAAQHGRETGDIGSNDNRPPPLQHYKRV